MPEIIESLPKRLREKWDKFARAVFSLFLPTEIHSRENLSPSAQYPSLVIGYSGGPDSTALLFACAHLRENWNRLGKASLHAPAIAAAHFDHGLRGSSNADADFCKIISAAIGATFISEKMSVSTDRAGGVETYARTMRIAFLKRAAAHFAEHFYEPNAPDEIEYRTPLRPVCVLLAHTMDDQAETVLMNIARGAGARGAAGMPAVSLLSDYGTSGDENHFAPETALLLRPFLNFSKREILSLLAESGIEYLIDETNTDADYTVRNKIRGEVLPALEKCYPAAAEKLAKFAGIMAGTEAEAEARAAAFFEKYERPFCALFPGIFIPGEPRIQGDFLPKHALRFLSPHVRARVYFDWLKGGKSWRADFAAFKKFDDALFADAPANVDGIFETSGNYVWQPGANAAAKNNEHPIFYGDDFNPDDFGESPVFIESCGELIIATVITSPDTLDKKIEIPKSEKICGIGGTATLREIFMQGNQFALAAPLTVSKPPLLFKEIASEYLPPPVPGAPKITVKKYYANSGIPPSIIRRIRILVDAKGRPLWHPRVSENPAAFAISQMSAHEKTLVFVFLGADMRHI